MARNYADELIISCSISIAGVQRTEYSDGEGDHRGTYSSPTSYARHRYPHRGIHSNAFPRLGVTHRKSHRVFLESKWSRAFPLLLACLLTIFLNEYSLSAEKKKRGNTIILMDYYYTIHEIVVAKSQFFIATRRTISWAGGTWNLRRKIYFQSRKKRVAQNGNRAYLHVVSSSFFYPLIFPFYRRIV